MIPAPIMFGRWWQVSLLMSALRVADAFEAGMRLGQVGAPKPWSGLIGPCSRE
jgi:hypothetical protein